MRTKRRSLSMPTVSMPRSAIERAKKPKFEPMSTALAGSRRSSSGRMRFHRSDEPSARVLRVAPIQGSGW
jgi:hypothetical protein